MAKDTVLDWNPSAANNTDVSGINIAEGCPASGINDAIRALMSQIAAWITSTAGPLLKSGGAMTGDIAMTYTSTIKDGGNLGRSVGYRSLPINNKTAAYQLALSDIGQGISIVAGGITVPANAITAFSVGDAIVIYNSGSASQTIAGATGVTLRLVGSTSIGNRILAQYGLCTIVQVATDEWVCSGGGLS